MGSGGDSLQSICYSRGSLRLLDQRRLPLETVYLDVRDCTDGWNAIRDMVVRGAPAIAISAALSLAVEAFKSELNGTPVEAVSFLSQKLDYLVSSRLTAVNLSDAATKLKNLVGGVVSTASDSKTVIEAYIEAAETMLTDDVTSNKAIGSHGSSFLQRQLKDFKRLSVLTHCNTGRFFSPCNSWLWYCSWCYSVTSFQRSSRNGFLHRDTTIQPGKYLNPIYHDYKFYLISLTAFELVHDKIPATLIADSAAAALMKAGRVNAVIVGADRIAANGDTANKIGTYSLALCASYHKVPFYVAAPMTSVDLSLPSGEQIVIEERTAKELLCSRGGLGEQVAASGISVWNPAFDVTPASLITGIITEKVILPLSTTHLVGNHQLSCVGLVSKCVA
ncbi:Methylthioribose-1-phosphate isomerase [Acorus calamus]|uniref:Methylthioribose-1-phosphate isomerase n=1 Tax=Acorus calamus TaxID=4465 RepID=A0AAV9DL82_ACOCL|nr:Methylthioribose-1-phosphate isomerase [Acorus calamus]